MQKFINKQTYYFNLSAIYKIHSVFYIFFLKLYNCKLNDNFILKYLVLKLIDNEQE
jgi:hypothetical protein